jgi:hypothetical protein
VDLLVLDDAPLELAGRVAVGGRLLFEDDQVARVRSPRRAARPPRQAGGLCCLGGDVERDLTCWLR